MQDWISLESSYPCGKLGIHDHLSEVVTLATLTDVMSSFWNRETHCWYTAESGDLISGTATDWQPLPKNPNRG